MQKLTLQSLTDSLWTFSILMSLCEAGALPFLEKGTTLNVLIEETDIPEQVLSIALNLLIEVGMISYEDSYFKASGDLANIIEAGSPSRVISLMRSNFGQARELIKVSRQHSVKTGWHHTDEDILQAQGLFSEIVATDFVSLFSELQALAQKPKSRFLDVGAGVGRIALKMCELYQNLHVVALEPADSPFNLALSNIETSTCKDRISLVKMGIQDLNEIEAFDIVWVAQGFIADEYFIPGLKRIKNALKPGGMIFTAEFIETPPGQKTAEAYIMDFLSVLYGAYRTPSEILNLFKKQGFINLKQVQYGKSFSVVTAVNP